MRLVSEEKIATISFIYALVMVLSLTFSTGGLFIAKKFHTLNKDLTTLEQDYLNEQRKDLKIDVSQQVQRITSLRTAMRDRLERQLMDRVQETQKMAENIYTNMSGKYTDTEISTVIREAIRPMRFNEKQGYFFIFNTSGELILYPLQRNLEGSNLINGETTIAGEPEVIRDLIATATLNKEGYCRYDWTKPGDNASTQHPKVSYVSHFQQLDWVIGTGEYSEELDLLAQKDIARELGAMYNLKTNDYYFVYQLHNIDGGKDFATMLINSNRPDLVGKKISDDYTDPRGNLFRKEFLQGIRKNGEAQAIYWYKKPDGSGIGRKMTYFILYPEWNWIIARGIYLDRIDSVIADQKSQLKTKVQEDIVLLCFIFLVAAILALVVAYFYSQGLQAIFNRYKRTQEEHLTTLEKLNRTLEIQSHTDNLTQAHNRAYFNKQLGIETARTARYATPLSLIIFDVDHFKSVNDTFGHLTGDIILRELAELVQKHIRKSDLLARWGGEEFVILTPNMELENTGHFAETLRQLIEKHTFTDGHHITCSFGVSSYTSPEDSDAFLMRADNALYQAKKAGRNRYAMQ